MTLSSEAFREHREFPSTWRFNKSAHLQREHRGVLPETSMHSFASAEREGLSRSPVAARAYLSAAVELRNIPAVPTRVDKRIAIVLFEASVQYTWESLITWDAPHGISSIQRDMSSMLNHDVHPPHINTAPAISHATRLANRREKATRKI